MAVFPRKLRTFRILVVEDNPADVFLLEEALKECDFAVQLDHVSDGEAAIEWIRTCDEEKRRPDLVILDLNLPKRSGHEVLQSIRSNEATRSLPVIVMSSSVSSRDIGRAYEFQANSYVRKPGDLDQLFEVVRMIERIWLGTVTLPPR